MDPLCEYCGAQQALVYCKSDEARLCLPCDLHVHSANSLSRRHLRFLLCDRCTVGPAEVRCKDEQARLCAGCRWDGGGAGSHDSGGSLYRPISFYSGCPTMAEFSRILAGGESCNNGASMMMMMGIESTVDENCSVIGEMDPMMWMGLGSDSSLGIPEQNKQQSRSNPDQLMLNLQSNGNIILGFPPGSVCPSMSLSLSNMTGESSVADYQDCVVSPMFLDGESPWDANLETSGPQARNEAKMRYNEKKKNRLFGKHIRYASRKARADNRKRVKGRFVRAGETYDYDPLLSKASEDAVEQS